MSEHPAQVFISWAHTVEHRPRIEALVAALADLSIVGDSGLVLEEMVRIWRTRTNQPRTEAIASWTERFWQRRVARCSGARRFFVQRLRYQVAQEEQAIAHRLG